MTTENDDQERKDQKEDTGKRNEGKDEGDNTIVQKPP